MRAFLANFGQSNRDQGEKSLAGTMVQTSALLNSKFVKERVRADRGRLSKLLNADPPAANNAIVDELFLATVGRLPSPAEKDLAIGQLQHIVTPAPRMSFGAWLIRPSFSSITKRRRLA